MRAGRWSLPLKTAAADRLVTGAAFLVVLLAASLVAAIPIYADAVAESSLRARLARVPVEDANAQLVVDESWAFARRRDGSFDRGVLIGAGLVLYACWVTGWGGAARPSPVPCDQDSASNQSKVRVTALFQYL